MEYGYVILCKLKKMDYNKCPDCGVVEGCSRLFVCCKNRCSYCNEIKLGQAIRKNDMRHVVCPYLSTVQDKCPECGVVEGCSRLFVCCKNMCSDCKRVQLGRAICKNNMRHLYCPDQNESYPHPSSDEFKRN